MKSIKELIAEEQAASGDEPTLQTPLPKSHLQQPPHLRGMAPVPAKAHSDPGMTLPPQALPKAAKPKAALRNSTADTTMPPRPLPAGLPELARADTSDAQKAKSFFSRLIGG